MKKYIYLLSFVFIILIFVSNFFIKDEEKFPVLNFEDWLSEDVSRQEFFKNQMAQALRDFGFFALTHHGITPQEMEAVYQSAQAFFSLPVEEKKRYEGVIRNRGYKGFNPERADKIADLQEYWHVGKEEKGNIWPERLSSFKPVFTHLYQKGEEIAGTLLEICASIIGEESHFFAERMQEGESVLRTIHYLPPEEGQHLSTTWKAAHRDPNLLTLIMGISSEGLQIERPNGRWLAVPWIKEAIVVSASDMLERLSNGYFKSTPHRVISQQSSSRYAYPFFAHLDRKVSLEPTETVVKKTGGVRYFSKISVEQSLKNKNWF